MVPELLDKCHEHLEFEKATAAYANSRRRAAAAEIDAILRERLLAVVAHRLPAFDRYADEVAQRKYDPYAAVDRILSEAGLDGQRGR